MKKFYAKTALYLYPCIDKVNEQIDELLEKRALASMNDFSPCITQCEKMVELGVQNANLLELKERIARALSGLSAEETALLEFKYFHSRKKEDMPDGDVASRTYFRRQQRVAEKFAELLEGEGITDEIFERDYLSVEFIRELYRRVKLREEASRKKDDKERKDKLSFMRKSKSEYRSKRVGASGNGRAEEGFRVRAKPSVS